MAVTTYEDDRLTEVKNDEASAIKNIETTYDNMAKDSDAYFKAQIDASKEWADKQAQLQQENTDFAIEKIEQQKDQLNKDYTKEQSGAYIDWQKESNRYGANAEQMASQGLANTGYSESSQVTMFNTYQNRVASAREGYNKAVLEYNNNIKEAQLQNNSILAQIYADALKEQLELSLAGFQYKNTLLTAKLEKKMQTEQNYHSRYMDVLSQINAEKSLALQREQLAFQKQQYADEKTYAYAKGSSGGSKGKSASGKSVSYLSPQMKGSTTKDKLDSALNNVSTAYYQGSKNPDAKKYGTFSNHYQPKGISGHGTLSKTGETIEVATQVKYGVDKGKKQTVVQNVWKAEDGTLWYWEGRENKYKPLS